MAIQNLIPLPNAPGILNNYNLADLHELSTHHELVR